jgi:hypothetical protein
VLNAFIGLPSLVPAIKRRRERKRLIRHLEHRREFWRKALAVAEVPVRIIMIEEDHFEIGGDPDEYPDIDDNEKRRISADIRRVEGRCNADLSAIKARIAAIDLRSLAKRADKYGIPMPDVIYTDGANGERYSAPSWVALLEWRKTEMPNKEKIQLRLDVQAKRDERMKRRTEILVPLLNVGVQLVTAAAAVISALVALAALKK